MKLTYETKHKIKGIEYTKGFTICGEEKEQMKKLFNELKDILDEDKINK